VNAENDVKSIFVKTSAVICCSIIL